MRASILVAAHLLFLGVQAQNACDGLNAAFTWNATTAAGNPVQFINGTTGTGQETVWQWSFGDGTTSNAAQPLHEFPGPGTYTVCLVATTYFITNAGTALTCVDEYCSAVTVAGVNNCSWLNAGFTWGAGANGVEFNYQPPTPGAQYAYQWSFGDGTTAATQNVFHTYASAGTYEVCLTVVAYQSNTSAPCTATSCQMVTWSGGGNACDGLNAAFSWSTVTATGGVQFSNGTTGTGQQTTWSWNFGDGTTSTEPQPLHVFPGPGTYEVCLTAISIFLAPNAPALTCLDETCTTVTVGGGNVCDGLNAAYAWNSTTAAGNPVQFINGTTGTGQQTTWSWDFGDGTTSSAAQPVHEFPGPGTYEVCLTAISIFINNTGAALTCVDEHCAAVTIAGEPQECDPSFALEIESAPSNAGFTLTASTNLPNQGITWAFANGLVLYGPSIQVALGSVLDIELCITAWYQPANSTDTCWAEVCGMMSQLGFAVGVQEQEPDGVSSFIWPNPASELLFVETTLSPPLSIAIHGADGRLERLLTAMGSPACIELNGLTPGLKAVAVSSGNAVERFRLVKE